MADIPWQGKLLSPGQIAQRLKALKCVKIGKNKDVPNSELWKPPHGPDFWISLDDCYAEDLEEIVTQIKEWSKNF